MELPGFQRAQGKDAMFEQRRIKASVKASRLAPDARAHARAEFGHAAKINALRRDTDSNRAADAESREAAQEESNDDGRAITQNVRSVAWDLGALPIFPPDASPPALSTLKAPSSVLQPKLEIGAVDDPLEREADTVADRVMRMADPAPSITAAPPRVSRKCAACEEEEKKVRMKPAGAARSFGAAPPTVHEALREPGRPLDPATRAFFEPRFARDFSGVRVHIGALAERSAQELGADAYTVGHDIAFRANRFAPDTDPGRRLLAHELTHVTQQSQARERDSAFGRNSQTLRRKLRADKAGEPAPGTRAANDKAATPPTRAEVVEDYLRKLSPGGAPTVDRASGEVKLADSFCHKRGFFERVGRGFVSGAKTGAGIGVYALGIGALPGALIGGLIGAVAGVFGADSQAEESSTPTGSTCICDLAESKNTWTIHIHDFPTPLNIGGGAITEPVTSNLDKQKQEGFVVVPAPGSQRIFGDATVSGKLETPEPWLILGHELCGHAWLQDRMHAGDDEEGHVPGEDLRHHRTVERENKIRFEHGLEARGFRLKDPFCGESFFRDRGDPQGPPQFGPPQQDSGKTRLEECQSEREKYYPDQAKRFRVDERIP
jgi:Domain of unknown function (DUF4157)